MRRPLGIAIVGGLLVSQMLTLYTTPVVYLYLDRFRLWAARARAEARARDARARGRRMKRASTNVAATAIGDAARIAA